MKLVLAVLLALSPLLSSCSQPYAIRFLDRAFPTRPGQKVQITTLRGKTEVQAVIGSRDIVVRGTVETLADSPERAVAQAEAVKVVDTSNPNRRDELLRLEVAGVPASGDTRLNAEFLVPKDVHLEIRDGPEDLVVSELDAGIAIQDGAGHIVLQGIKGPIEISDQDGDITVSGCQGPVTIDDRRGDIIVEEVTGDIEIKDREGDALIQSVTGDVTLAKQGRGNVRLTNLDGNWYIKEWLDNPTKPIIDTIWPKGEGGTRAVPSAASHKEAAGGRPATDGGDGKKDQK